jgi:uncharacterized protein YggE
MKFVALVSLLFSPLLAVTALAHEGAIEPSVTVIGFAEIAASPDMAQVSVGVTTQAVAVGDALAANNAKTRDVIAVIRKKGVAERDIQTTQFSVSPQYSHNRDGNPPTLDLYRVTNRIEVTVRDIEKAGDLLDAAVAGGANEVFGLDFGVQESSALLDRARRNAMDNARTKAELYASAAGLPLGRAIVITEETSTFDRPRPMAEISLMKASSVPLAAGTMTFSAEIRVRYSLGDPD